MSSLYRVENLRKRRSGERKYQLCIRHLVVPPGALLAITGPSGCGKSTTLDILGFGLAPDTADNFTFGPEAISIPLLWREKRHDLLANMRLTQVGYVLQSGELLPFLTVGENICLVGLLAGYGQSQVDETGHWLAATLGIDHLWAAMPAAISVGERQRAAIARALASRPHVIIADEPTAALDPLHADKVMEVFLQCIDRFEAALILATHNAAWARAGGLMEIKFQLLAGDEGTTAVLDDRESQ